MLQLALASYNMVPRGRSLICGGEMASAAAYLRVSASVIEAR